MRLKDELILGGLTGIDTIGAFLDGLSHAERMREIQALCSDAMARLYQRAEDAVPLDESHFVPSQTPAATEVIHHGRNSLPVFRSFQKRFCRSASVATGNTAVFGYNHNPPLLRALGIGPGYFVLRPTAGLAHWERRGAQVIDYHLVPDGPVAPGWPRVVPQTRGLQGLVFAHMRDFMRRVSAHVSIGAAYKHESPMDAYFVLCREPG